MTHPARKGIDSPHEIRGWRDAQPGIAVGMEGAPGHQGAGIPAPHGPGSGRGGYDNNPSANSFPRYPLESYRTWGGFDWMAATVGGLWDSLLAEGKPWWMTANSDSHYVYADTAVRGPATEFNTNGYRNDPVYGGDVNLGDTDFWPGYYSRGVSSRLRAGQGHHDQVGIGQPDTQPTRRSVVRGDEGGDRVVGDAGREQTAGSCQWACGSSRCTGPWVSSQCSPATGSVCAAPSTGGTTAAAPAWSTCSVVWVIA